ncbi:hypothetical protein ACFQV8_00045 [Pseudonocardia benzenivorans]
MGRHSRWEAVDVALGHLEEHGAYVRAGYHGKTMGGRSAGRYERATGLAVIKLITRPAGRTSRSCTVMRRC